MSAAYEEMTDARLIYNLRCIRHEDRGLNLPLIGEALARLMEKKPQYVPKPRLSPHSEASLAAIGIVM